MNESLYDTVVNKAWQRAQRIMSICKDFKFKYSLYRLEHDLMNRTSNNLEIIANDWITRGLLEGFQTNDIREAKVFLENWGI